ncbi:hypothetical protein ACTJIJ_14120 [Niabella sp. 22666]|uniref:hypothetical protein n=1 Tax=Niabella sp. 22666 TaxID=3453954 RepID=UPI003F830685
MVYKIHTGRLAVYTALGFCMATSAIALGQNVTSPYSTLGIGDIDTKTSGRYSISGSTSTSRRNGNTYNDANPASLTSLALKVINFDLLGKGRASTFQASQTDSVSAVSKDFIIRNISLAFRPHNRTGFAFGLKPYSSVNYKYPLPDAVYNSQLNGYTRSVEGTGGINQVYGSFGYALTRHLSAGVTASYLFGSTQKNTTYLDPGVGLDIKKEEYSFYSGSKVLAGLQYYTSPARKWQHTIGITASVGSDLKGYAKTEYISADSTFLEQSNGSTSFKMPASTSLGYTAANKHGLSLSAEANYYYWPKQQLNYINSYTSPSTRLSAGWEYSKIAKYSFDDAYYEKYYLGMGFTAQNSYYHLNGNKIWDYAVTLGGGYNISGNLYGHTGIEFGYKGQNSQGQIRERYTQFTLGLTIRSLWYHSARINDN